MKIHNINFSVAFIFGLTITLLVLLVFTQSSPVNAAVCNNGETTPSLPSNIPEADRQTAAEAYCAEEGRGGVAGSGNGQGSLSPSDNSTSVNDEGGTARTDINKDQCTAGEGEALRADDDCLILKYVVIGINFLSALAGMVIIASIMFAGFQYMTAQDNAGQIEQARKRIIMALTALVLFIFMYALLNFLVPGGVL